MTTERVDPPLIPDERDTLRAYLDYHRATLAMKCDGLFDEDLRRQSMPPSTLSRLGPVSAHGGGRAHLVPTGDQRRGHPPRVVGRWRLPGGAHARAATRSEAFDAWQTEVGHSRRIEQEAESLDTTGHQRKWGEDVSLRLVMLHLIHEYARHNGHADFLREGTPTDQAWIETLFGHVKGEWPHLEKITDPAELELELDRKRTEYNSIRLHAAIGYVTPDDEHEGRGEAIRQARLRGLAAARQTRIDYRRTTTENQP